MPDQAHHLRQDVREPRGMPHGGLGEQTLHVDRDVQTWPREQVVEAGNHGPTTTVCSGRQETVTGSPCAMGVASRFCSSTITSTSPQATR